MTNENNDDSTEEQTPFSASGLENIDEFFSLSKDSMVALALVDDVNVATDDLFENGVPTALKTLNSGDFLPPATRAALGVADQQEKIYEALAPIVAAVNFEEYLPAVPTAAIASQIVRDIQIPASVLADMAQIQPASATALVGGYPTQTSSEVDTQTPSATATTTTTTIAEVETSDVEPLEEPTTPTTTVDPQFGIAQKTIDATLPYSSQLGTEDAVEIPALVVQKILSGEEAYQWFTSLNTKYQNGIVGFIWVSTALYVYPPAVYVTPVAVPAITQAIVDSGEWTK